MYHHRTTRSPRRAIAITLLAASMTTALAGTGSASEAPSATPAPALSAHQLAELADVVARMPAGWVATDVMRRQVVDACADGQPLEELARAVADMPDDWSATETMRRQVLEACGQVDAEVADSAPASM